MTDMRRGPRLPPGRARLAAKRPGAGVTIDPKRLIRLREDAELSRAQLAAKMSTIDPDEFSYTPDAVAKLENGRRRPKLGTLRYLCLALGCTPEDLRPVQEKTEKQDSKPAVCPECQAQYGHEPGCSYAT